MATIATHCGHSMSQEHNERDEERTAKDGHIDRLKTHLNETLRSERISDAYDRIFGAAQAEYDEKQKRADRLIGKYFKKIEKDKQKHPAYEMIIGIYPGENETIPDEVGKEIMKEFAENWAERNPNLELVGAYYHADENGQPHMHLDYIPWYNNESGRGMKKQTGLDKALRAMGFEKKEAERDENGKLLQAWETPQIAWQRRENDYLDSLCRERGILVEHPERGHKTKHLHTEQYQALKDNISTLENTQKETEHSLQRLIAEKEAAKKELEKLKERTTLNTEIGDTIVDINELIKQTQPGKLLQKDKQIVPLNIWKQLLSNYSLLVNKSNRLLEKQQNERPERERLEAENAKLKKEVGELKAENSKLETALKKVKDEFSLFKDTIKKGLSFFKVGIEFEKFIHVSYLEHYKDTREKVYGIKPGQWFNYATLTVKQDKLIGDLYCEVKSGSGKCHLYGDDFKVVFSASEYEPDSVKPGASITVKGFGLDKNDTFKTEFSSKNALDNSSSGGLTVARGRQRQIELELSRERGISR